MIFFDEIKFDNHIRGQEKVTTPQASHPYYLRGTVRVAGDIQKCASRLSFAASRIDFPMGPCLQG